MLFLLLLSYPFYFIKDLLNCKFVDRGCTFSNLLSLPISHLFRQYHNKFILLFSLFIVDFLLVPQLARLTCFLHQVGRTDQLVSCQLNGCRPHCLYSQCCAMQSLHSDTPPAINKRWKSGINSFSLSLILLSFHRS